jgi:hypothetical protein
VTTVANAALLRAVRVGEHKDFTRLVFEFDSVIQYSQPVLKDKDTISMTFLKSEAPHDLTLSNPQRSKKHFNAIAFDQRGSDLTAHVAVTSPHFKLKAHALPTPYRVMIDISWLGAPLQTKIAPPPDLQNVKKLESLTPEETEPKGTEEITPSPKPQKSDAPVVEVPENIASMPEKEEILLKPPDNVVVSRPLQTTMPGTTQLAPVTPRYSKLQLYLMVALIVFNVIIIIFVVMSWFRLRKTEVSGYDEIADALAVQDTTVTSIDRDIREKFQKYEDL